MLQILKFLSGHHSNQQLHTHTHIRLPFRLQRRACYFEYHFITNFFFRTLQEVFRQRLLYDDDSQIFEHLATRVDRIILCVVMWGLLSDPHLRLIFTPPHLLPHHGNTGKFDINKNDASKMALSRTLMLMKDSHARSRNILFWFQVFRIEGAWRKSKLKLLE